MRNKTFEQMCVELDATLLYARVRMAYKDGLGIKTIANRFNLPPSRVRSYIRGPYCTTKKPSLPKRLCPEWSKTWGTPILRTKCSEDRMRRNSRFHRDSYFEV